MTGGTIAWRWAASFWSAGPTRDKCWSLVYDPLRKEAPGFVEVYFATAELALEKYDFALAADTLRGGTAHRGEGSAVSLICWPAPMHPTTRRMDAALAAALGDQSTARR